MKAPRRIHKEPDDEWSGNGAIRPLLAMTQAVDSVCKKGWTLVILGFRLTNSESQEAILYQIEKQYKTRQSHQCGTLGVTIHK